MDIYKKKKKMNCDKTPVHMGKWIKSIKKKTTKQNKRKKISFSQYQRLLHVPHHSNLLEVFDVLKPKEKYIFEKETSIMKNLHD
jgi:hypothetical protein